MKKQFLFLALLFISISTIGQNSTLSSELYELRIYHCEDQKLPDLLNRFKNHTTALFEKHGMVNIAYWVPTQEGTKDLYYVLRHKSAEAKELSWKNFIADPTWNEVRKKSEENGKIITSIESINMKLNTSLTPKIKKNKKAEPMLFEMRTYYCLPDRYPNIVARFKDHTMKLFKKHNMQNIMYFETIEKEGVQPKLLYFLSHKNAETAKTSWDGFRKDPDWIKVRDASEVSGKIVEKVVSVYMTPTDFSKMK